MDDELHIYVRVSTESQVTDGFGLDTQVEMGNRVSKSLGLKPVIHNEGSKSSSSDDILNRPVLKNLLFDIEEGKIRNVWVFNQDRLSRNENVWSNIRRVFKQNKVTLYVSEGNKYDLSSHMDDLMFGIISEITKYDNLLRTERLKRGRLQKLKDGDYWKGGPPPFGYKIEKKKLVPHPEERVWVERIYEEYSQGTSVSKISDILLENGVQSRRGNVLFSKESITKILQNTHYEGYYFYTDNQLQDTVRVECPSILSPKLVKSVRERLSKRTKKSNYQKTTTLLKPFLECGHCNSKFGQRINKSQYHNHYYCMGNQQRFKKMGKGSPKICFREDGGRVRSVDINDTDKIVWDSVVKVLSESHLFREDFKLDQFKGNNTHSDIIKIQKNISNQIKKREQDLKKLNETNLKSIIENLLDDELNENYKKFVQEVEKKKTIIKGEIDELNDQLYDLDKREKWIDWRKGFDQDIEHLKNGDLTTDEKLKFLNSSIEKITIKTLDNQTHSLKIVFTRPFVGDELKWVNPKNKSKGYEIVEGIPELVLTIDSSDKRLKKTLED